MYERIKPDPNTKLLWNGIAVIVGAPVTFLGLIVVTGDVQTPALIMFCSVVLTAGLALLVWIGVFWIVGRVTLAFLQAFLRKAAEKEKPSGRHEQRNRTSQKPRSRPSNPPLLPKRPVLSRDEIAMIGYMKLAENHGMTQDKVFAAMRRQGWSDSEIQGAYALRSGDAV